MTAKIPSRARSLLDLRSGRLFGTPPEGDFTPSSDEKGESFAEKFCCHFNVPIEEFEAEILQRALYPHARWLNLFAPGDFFHPDCSFVSGVGRLTHRRDFDGEAKDFQRDPCNAGFLRRHCRLRVSVGRMRSLLDEIWPQSQAV